MNETISVAIANLKLVSCDLMDEVGITPIPLGAEIPSQKYPW